MLLVTAGALVLALWLHRYERLEGWLFFRYARAAFLAALFSLACLVSGHALLVRVLRRTLPFDEHLTLALALGVVAFFFASFGFGIVGLYGPVFFLGCPLLLLALGGRSFLRAATRFRRHVAGIDFRLRLDPLRGTILAFGLLGVLYLWFTILTPQNASFDSRWYHQPIAEIYVAQGGIEPFSEGWVPGAYPQLASLLYAWAFSMPGSSFDRVVTAAHLEFCVLLMTLVGIPAIVRRILGERTPLAWAALFLFPGIFCYDSSLVLGADHVVAVFAAPIFLVSLRYLEAPSRAYAALLGAFIAGVIDTKYTGVILVVLPLAVVLVRAVRGVRARERGAAGAAWLVAATTLALTAPHWLKNLVFYGDPLFPSLRRWLPAHPWHEAAEAPFPAWFSLHHPPLSVESALDMLKTLATFSFVPHDFPQFHRDVPVFGSLFTLVTPLIFFLGRRPRLNWLIAGTYAGIAAWFWIHQFDRYLQPLVPWMAAATAIALVLVWRMGRALRVAVGCLVGVQVVWGAAVPFIPSHRGAGGNVIAKVVIDQLGRGYRGESGQKLLAYPEWEAIGRAIPKGAKLLVHEEELRAGLAVRSAIDYSGDQGAFYWGEPGASSPAEIHRLLRKHDITHVLWTKNTSHGSDTVAAGLAFFDFVTHHTDVIDTFGGYVLAALRAGTPPDTRPGSVAYYPCETARTPLPPEAWSPVWAPRGLGWPIFSPGLYRLADMARWPGDGRPIALPAPGVAMDQAFERAEFVVFDARCHGALPDEVRERFELLAARGHAMMLRRRAP